MLLSEWDGGTEVLCPSFNISKIDENNFGCLAKFSSEACNRTVTLTLETWINGSLLPNGPRGTVFIDCNLQSTLADAIFTIIETVAPILTANNTCQWTEWTSWSACSKSCGDGPGESFILKEKCLICCFMGQTYL